MTDSERIAELERQIIELRQAVEGLQARQPMVSIPFFPEVFGPPYKVTCAGGYDYG